MGRAWRSSAEIFVTALLGKNVAVKVVMSNLNLLF